jgi:hypothetical protein
VFLELGKALSFFLSILSICPLVMNAFFVPGTRWQERLGMALVRAALAGCVCFASGLLFRLTQREYENPAEQIGRAHV